LNIYFSNEIKKLLPPKVAKASMSQYIAVAAAFLTAATLYFLQLYKLR